jgi:uncharacterized protein
MDELDSVIEALQELVSDTTVPQNVRVKLGHLVKALQSETGDVAIRINKVLDDLEEISNDVNLPSYTRTQLWNVSCMLEMIQ